MSDPQPTRALPADERPFDHTAIDTEALPPTPTRDQNISAVAWRQAPDVLLDLGGDVGVPAERTAYKRRIGQWLL